MIELSKIAAISGQGGLFEIKTALKNGVMMESLDEKKTKIVASATSKVSILSEISIYTTTADGSVSLESVLKSLHKKHGVSLPVSSKSDGADLKNLLKGVLNEVDFDRVYVSDIKKVVTWYGILVVNTPELFVKAPEVEKSEEHKSETTTEASFESTQELKPAKKAKAPKAEQEKGKPEEPKAKKPAAMKK